MNIYTTNNLVFDLISRDIDPSVLHCFLNKMAALLRESRPSTFLPYGYCFSGHAFASSSSIPCAFLMAQIPQVPSDDQKLFPTMLRFFGPPFLFPSHPSFHCPRAVQNLPSVLTFTPRTSDPLFPRSTGGTSSPTVTRSFRANKKRKNGLQMIKML